MTATELHRATEPELAPPRRAFDQDWRRLARMGGVAVFGQLFIALSGMPVRLDERLVIESVLSLGYLFVGVIPVVVGHRLGRQIRREGVPMHAVGRHELFGGALVGAVAGAGLSGLVLMLTHFDLREPLVNWSPAAPRPAQLRQRPHLRGADLARDRRCGRIRGRWPPAAAGPRAAGGARHGGHRAHGLDIGATGGRRRQRHRSRIGCRLVLRPAERGHSQRRNRAGRRFRPAGAGGSGPDQTDPRPGSRPSRARLAPGPTCCCYPATAAVPDRPAAARGQAHQ